LLGQIWRSVQRAALADKLFTISPPRNLRQGSADATKFDRVQRIGYRMQPFCGIFRGLGVTKKKLAV
jgi:hypothetical protein